MGVLVLGVGGNVSQGILKALALSTVPVRVVAGCIDALSAGLYAADRALIAPRADDAGFVEWVEETCRREGVRAVLSGVEPNLLALAPHRAALRERTGTVCVVSPPEVLAVAQDKLATARWLEEHGLPFAESADSADAVAVDALRETCGFPLIAKPRHGKGGHGVLRIDGEDGLALVRGRPGLVVQRLLGSDDDEYTAGCFCGADGRPRGTIVMRRRLVDGTTATAEVGEYEAIRELVEEIVMRLRPVGPCNVQLRTHAGRAVPFEFNVRFSGTTPIRARLGFNEVEAALRHLVLGEDVELPRVTRGVALRYWNELYVDEAAVESLRRNGVLAEPAAHPLAVEDWGTRGDGNGR